jgi:hypothetical protein
MTTKRVTIAKYMGDHDLSWAVFVDGKVKWDGMSRSEALYRKKKEEAELERGARG